MKKFIEWMEEHFIPIAAKVGAEKHLGAIRDGFVAIIPIIMAGAFAILINNFAWESYQHLMTTIFGHDWKSWGGAIWNGSYAIMSLLISFTVAYNLAKARGKDGLASGLVSVAAFIIFFGDLSKTSSFLGTNGLLLAIIVALIVGDLMCWLLGNKRLVMKMPAGVPPAIARSFASLFPAIIIMVIAASVERLFALVSAESLPVFIYQIIQAPLQGVVGSFWGVLVLIAVIQILWFFGLHGSNMMLPIVNGVLLPLTIDNMHRVAEGLKPLYIVNDQFLNSFVFLGGAGATITLIIAIFIVNKTRKKKSEVQLVISKIALAPGIFNINEPLIFGMPICLDPIYFIPFLLVPLLNAVIAFFAMTWHLVPLVQLEVSWTLPPILSGALATNSWQGAVLSILLLVIDVIIYMPFVMIAADRDVKNMEEAVAAEQAAAEAKN
ncbi:PTS transporter subunit EIIC [uncultured Clostridium sp.]|jgi:PTS system cellobiose-specific IIC component|uniref:PTS sugar transporter subunit IIC n=1 Tax=uncultured Clostridium sp. TaxID=59620 RepID=UPI00262BF71F|nr:PTS transporter subunit EIIC [uncultured Clostridium sp.]